MKRRAVFAIVLALTSACLADGMIPDELEQAIAPIGRSIVARRFATPFGPAPAAADDSPASIYEWLRTPSDNMVK